MGDGREGMRTIEQFVGAKIRQCRERRGKVLHDVASAAREIGLTWDASAVSRIEVGKREISMGEFLLLPWVLTLAFNEPVTLADLLPTMEDIEQGDDIYLEILGREIPFLTLYAMLAEPRERFVKNSAYFRTAGKDFREELVDATRRAQVAREPDEEIESFAELRALAAEFGVHAADVFNAYPKLWGQFTSSLKSEREKRLIKSDEDLSNPTRVRTLRGHITRQLKEELRAYFAEHPPEPMPTAKTPAEKEN